MDGKRRRKTVLEGMVPQCASWGRWGVQAGGVEQSWVLLDDIRRDIPWMGSGHSLVRRGELQLKFRN